MKSFGALLPFKSFSPFKRFSQTTFYCSALQGYNNSKAVVLEASFTPDSQFVMIGKSRLLLFIVFRKSRAS